MTQRPGACSQVNNCTAEECCQNSQFVCHNNSNNLTLIFWLRHIYRNWGAWTTFVIMLPAAVVAHLIEAMLHKPEGAGFDSRWGPWKFSSYLIPLSKFSSPWFQSASNRNEYQVISFRVKCDRRVELTALPSWLCRMSNWGWKHNIPPPSESSWLVTGKLYLYLTNETHLSWLQWRKRITVTHI